MRLNAILSRWWLGHQRLGGEKPQLIGDVAAIGQFTSPAPAHGHTPYICLIKGAWLCQ